MIMGTKKYEETGIEWLREVSGLPILDEDWHYHYVPNLDYELNRERLITGKSLDLCVDPKNIVGISYGYSYYGTAWGEHLRSLKRPSSIIHLNHSLNDLKNFINKSLSLESLDRITLFQIGTKYIIVNGQHRSCIAKFIDYPIKDANVYPVISGLTEEELLDYIYQKTEEVQSRLFSSLY